VSSGTGLELPGRRVEPQLLEEHLRELGIVVLAGVKKDFLDAPLLERERDRCRLHELRPIAYDGKDSHGGGEFTVSCDSEDPPQRRAALSPGLRGRKDARLVPEQAAPAGLKAKDPSLQWPRRGAVSSAGRAGDS
jgi:hypothetical protein